MDFSVQLGAYATGPEQDGKALFDGLIEQAVLCDRLGYESVTLTEHHLINILLMPAPLQLAVKIAALTRHLKIMTAVLVLPLHDMRVFAGELVTADILTDGRLLPGVGRGAFDYEMSRLGVPLAISRERFDESLDVLRALLEREEVAWDGKHYRFEPLTIMPRPMRANLPIMMAATTPVAIYHCARRGFHIQTTALANTHEHMVKQVDAFQSGRAEAGDAGRDLTLTLSRIGFVTRDEADKREKLELASRYYDQFQNVMRGPGTVDRGRIEPIERDQTLEALDANLMIGPPEEIAAKLEIYASLGVDRFILNPNFGADQAATLETITRFAEEVMPRFARR